MNISNREKILDISVNLARISDWVISENLQKKKRVSQFLLETKEFILSININDVSSKFKPTWIKFSDEFGKLLQDIDSEDKIDWAEKALTWANILQHRAKLA